MKMMQNINKHFCNITYFFETFYEKLQKLANFLKILQTYWLLRHLSEK